MAKEDSTNFEMSPTSKIYIASDKMSSGFSYPQPIFQSPIYNPAFYLTLDASGFLTYDYAQTLYLSKTDCRLTYISGITIGTATQGVALVPGVNADSSGIGALSCDSLTVNGSSITSAPAYVLSITPVGTAGNGKAVVLTGSGSILNINTLSTTGAITAGGPLNGFLAYGNQSAITSIGSLTELGINSTPTDEYFSITGSGLDYLDGSYTRMLTFTGSNATPVKFQIEVHNGTNATSGNSTWIGNYTNNDLRFGINNSTSMILITPIRLGLGTTSPSAPLHISGSNYFVFGAGDRLHIG
ncbi:unnamed protein product [Phytophthora lilii]|uniref:Unnamed protein product n=1 Tax=Phytophthora lilii TaxID=2077276 RepID=A0A9W6UEM9_9STRA|nr:unnamed protein product [Phytophthora lilii]